MAQTESPALHMVRKALSKLSPPTIAFDYIGNEREQKALATTFKSKLT